MKKNIIKILILSGEPAGIGLDLCIKLAYKKFPAAITILANHNAILDRARLYNKKIKILKKPVLHKGIGELHIIDVPLKQKVFPGKLEKLNSLAQLGAIDFAVTECMQKKYDALVTLPVNKKILSSQNKKFTGHTEYISTLCGTKNKEVMLLAHKNFKVALVTTHITLQDVPKSITKRKLEQTIRTLNGDLKNIFQIKNPRITITGLNPHAGEDGEFGIEEIKIITPIIKKLSKEGLNLIGPIPADTAFTKKYIKNTDSFLAMYHDQGLAPFKALAFNNGVNTTLGLPIIRTSVDHGTALDLVGSKKINGFSLYESISLAIKLAKNKKK
ncbi:4-hydroxythreonine-4-phosphate dehydrogenase PdxA [Methylophilaceae bacterium]|nr:4-hydroxythreonine-4-phosphate dehydrogenase PdxA [Methylophilaceae bacterium]